MGPGPHNEKRQTPGRLFFFFSPFLRRQPEKNGSGIVVFFAYFMERDG